MLTKKDALFCRHYSANADAELSAAKAELTPSRAQQLLSRPDALALVEQYAAANRRQALQARLAQGLGELDFSPGTDLAGLVRLLLNSRDGTAPREALPLKNVSEVKLQKDGGIEIKFFDRGRLLEALCGFATQESPGREDNLVSALEASAKSLWQK